MYSINDICSSCGGTTRHYDKVKRYVRTIYGRRYSIMVDRYICSQCRSVRRALPDSLIAFKHYEKRIIEDFVRDRASSFDIEFEDYPCELTIKKWKRVYK